MFKNKRRSPVGGDEEDLGYALPFPVSQRWNARYDVPRNSIDGSYETNSLESALGKETGNNGTFKLKRQDRSMLYGRRRRDLDTQGVGVAKTPASDDGEEEFSGLRLWLETLSELYMNDLDNRARWDPQWLNVTRRERFEGLQSTSISVVDYLAGDTVQRSELITSENALASALETRPDDSQVRVIMVSDLSRFVMGALGQTYSIDPEFWLEHLANSGYGASDSGLKVKNAVWLNWAERETRFRHHALPGPGQRTEWNLPRRTRSRKWVHIRWGRLGLLHYLGRKGFHEDEIEKRIADGRWTMERDVVLDKYGLLMTQKRQRHAAEKARKREKKNKERGGTESLNKSDKDTSTRIKTSNVYRAYSTFQSLPQNPRWWTNRDLRVMAPEGTSYWSDVDQEGKKTVIILFDPTRRMRHDKTNEETPSLTFMPRAMEIESYTEDERWRTADVDETYLDPPAPLLSKEELKKQKKQARRERHKEKRERLTQKFTHEKKDANSLREGGEDGVEFDTESSYTSDSEYDEVYQVKLRAFYDSPQWYTRDRDFARKYSLSTFNLVYRYISTIPTSQLLEDDSLIPAVLTRVPLDDLWQLLTELRLVIDQIDADLGADLHVHLAEAHGVMTRQNVAWVRSTLQELLDWVRHFTSNSRVMACSRELREELKDLTEDLQTLQTRADQTLNFLVASTGISQSSLVIDQTSGINKLTELAFFFVPLSFITSVFSMQVVELTSAPPPIWTWGLALGVVFLATYIVRSILRSPSIRIFAMHCRVLMLNRFTSSQARSPSRRLNSVGNRAIVKFVVFFGGLCLYALAISALYILALFLVHFGIWLGAAGTAAYYIVERWPDPAVLVPCFISIALAAGGMAGTWYWNTDIMEKCDAWAQGALDWMIRVIPAKWKLDNVDDDDLETEGIKMYTNQRLFVST